MNGFVIVLYTLVIVVSLLLIALILVQQPKSGGFGSTFGGLGESVFGAHTIGHLIKLTVVFVTIFFALTLTLAIVLSHMPEKKGVLNSTDVEALTAKAATETEETASAGLAVPSAEATEAR